MSRTTVSQEPGAVGTIFYFVSMDTWRGTVFVHNDDKRIVRTAVF